MKEEVGINFNKYSQSFVESTNDAEPINDLTADKLMLNQSIHAHDADEMVKKIAQLNAQVEALQSYVNPTQKQLEISRAAERNKQQQISELNTRME